MKLILAEIFCSFSEIICTKRKRELDGEEVPKSMPLKKRWARVGLSKNPTSVYLINNNREQQYSSGNIGSTHPGISATLGNSMTWIVSLDGESGVGLFIDEPSVSNRNSAKLGTDDMVEANNSLSPAPQFGTINNQGKSFFYGDTEQIHLASPASSRHSTFLNSNINIEGYIAKSSPHPSSVQSISEQVAGMDQTIMSGLTSPALAETTKRRGEANPQN
jgi:hypothetical protein